MTTWWEVNRYDWKIVPVEVSKETEKCIWIVQVRRDFDGQPRRIEARRDKKSDWQQYFATWQEAHDALIERALNDVDAHEQGLEHSRQVLAQLKQEKAP